MFENAGFPKSLDEDTVQEWLEKGRESKIYYKFLLIIWNEFAADYQALYLEDRDKLKEYQRLDTSNAAETLIAVYDVFSESRIPLK